MRRSSRCRRARKSNVRTHLGRHHPWRRHHGDCCRLGTLHARRKRADARAIWAHSHARLAWWRHAHLSACVRRRTRIRPLDVPCRRALVLARRTSLEPTSSIGSAFWKWTRPVMTTPTRTSVGGTERCRIRMARCRRKSENAGRHSIRLKRGKAGTAQSPDSSTSKLDVRARRNRQARRCHFLTESQCCAWSASEGGVSVETPQGRYLGNKLIVTAGSWASQMLAELDLPLEVVRKNNFWVDVDQPSLFQPGCLSCLCDRIGRRRGHGFPIFRRPGIKMAEHRGGETTTPQTVDRIARDEEAQSASISPLWP